MSLGVEFSLIVGIENSLAGPGPGAGRAPDLRAVRPSPIIPSDMIRKGVARWSAWRTDDDLGPSPPGIVGDGDCAADRSRPENGSQIHRTWAGAARYGPRQVGRPNKLAPYLDYLRERVAAFPELRATRLTRELRKRGYPGAYTAVKRFVAAIRPSEGRSRSRCDLRRRRASAQVDFARFVVSFEDEPGLTRIVWLFALVLGHSRHIVARFECIRTCRRCCAATWLPSRRSAACRLRSSTTA